MEKDSYFLQILRSRNELSAVETFFGLKSIVARTQEKSVTKNSKDHAFRSECTNTLSTTTMQIYR